jgi:hypothetical protein
MATQPRFDLFPESVPSSPLELVPEGRATRRLTIHPGKDFQLLRGVLVGMAICVPFWVMVAWIVGRMTGR